MVLSSTNLYFRVTAPLYCPSLVNSFTTLTPGWSVTNSHFPTIKSCGFELQHEVSSRQQKPNTISPQSFIGYLPGLWFPCVLPDPWTPPCPPAEGTLPGLIYAEPPRAGREISPFRKHGPFASIPPRSPAISERAKGAK